MPVGVDLWQMNPPAAGDSRALVRRVLSSYGGVAPEAWEFEVGRWGRPEVVAPACGLRFNVSHTVGCLVVAVCGDGEVGVDVERLQRPRVPLGVAGRWFAEPEIEALRALAEAEQPRRFLELWTLKEAYIKARGLGLALPLHHFWIDLSGPGPRLRGTPALDDDPGRWNLVLASRGEHLVAVATTSAPILTCLDAGQVLARDGT